MIGAPKIEANDEEEGVRHQHEGGIIGVGSQRQGRRDEQRRSRHQEGNRSLRVFPHEVDLASACGVAIFLSGRCGVEHVGSNHGDTYFFRIDITTNGDHY